MKKFSGKKIGIITAVSAVLVAAIVFAALFIGGVFSSEDVNEPPIDETRYYTVGFGYPDSMSEDDRAATVLPDSITLEEGSLLYAVPNPERFGYIFGGWYYDSAMTKLVSVEDTLSKNVVLYPLMFHSEDGEVTVDQQPVFVSALEKDESFTLTVKAKDAETLKKVLFINAVSEGNVQKEADVTDNGDGTFTVVPEGGFIAGGTYQFKALDRFDESVEEEDYIHFVQDGDVLGTDVQYYNVTIKREEYDSLRVDDKVIFVPLSDTEGFEIDGNGLISVSVGENGLNTEQNEKTGGFIYRGEALSVGAIVAIYEGELESDRTVAEGGRVSYVKIIAANGELYSYEIPGVEELLFIPDVLPIPENADIDPSEGIIKVDTSVLDYSDIYLNGEKYLDASTVADVDDYVAIYEGEFGADSISAYYKITKVEIDGEYTVLTVAGSSLDEIWDSTGMYQKTSLDLTLSDNEITELKNTITSQAEESGFDMEAAKFFTQLLAASGTENTHGANPLPLAVIDANGNDIPMSGAMPLVEVEAGVTALVIRLGHVDLEVELNNDLREISAIKDGVGLRALLHVQVPLTIETVLNGTEVLDSLHLKLTATFEQEIAVDIDFWYDIDWDFIIPVDAEVGANFDMGTYTGVGATFTMSTASDYDANFDWDKFIKAFDSTYEPAKAKISSIAKTLEALMDDPYEFFDEENGDSLIKQYQEMLEQDLEYVEILAVLLYKKSMFLDKFHIINVHFMFEFTVSAKANISVGMSFEHKTVKRFSFSIEVADERATQNLTTLEDGYTNFNFYAMGNLGIRIGIRGTFKIGLLDVKLNNVGLMVEVGPYVDMYGFFFFHYDVYEDAGTGEIEENLRFSGAYYIEIGIYMDVDFFGGIAHDIIGFTIHLAEPEWPIWKSGDGLFVCAPFSPVRNYNMGGNKTASFSDERELYSFYGVKKIDVKTGKLYSYLLDPEKFEVISSDPDILTFDKKSNTINVNITDPLVLSFDGELRIVYKGKGMPLTNEPIVSVFKVKWVKTHPNYTVTFNDYRYGDGYIETVRLFPKGSDKYGWQSFLEGTAPKGVNYPDYTPRAGYDFIGWEHISGGELFDPNEVLTSSVYLVPRLEARDDTPFTVRHYVQSLDNPEAYELYLEETKTGTTGTLVDFEHVIEVEGMSIDRSQRPIYSIHENVFGEGEHYYVYGVQIVGEGNSVVNYYYNRNSYDVTIESNNKDLRWHNEDGYYTRWTTAKYGETVDVGGFLTDIPGYTFRGWVDASTVNGVNDAINGTILDKIPPITGRSHYYAVYEAKNDIPYTVRHFIKGYNDNYDDVLIKEESFIGVANEVLDIEDLVLDINYNNVYASKNGYSYADITVSPYGNSVIDVNYFVDYYSVSWEGFENEIVENLYFEGQLITPPETAPAKEGYIFSHWDGYTEGMVMGTDSLSFYPVFVGDIVKYTVVHTRQDQDFAYNSERWTETEELTAQAGTDVTPAARSYDGFSAPVSQTVTVNGDGTTVITYKYARNAYNLTLKGEGKEDKNLVYHYEIYKELPSAYTYTREGYVLVGWYLEGDEEQTPVSYVDCGAMQDLTYVAIWEAIGISYSVEYYLESIDGSYDSSLVTLTGIINETYTAEVKEFPGFTFDEGALDNVKSGTITGESDQLVLKLYYRRNVYKVTWYDFDGSTKLGESQVTFGADITYPEALSSPERKGYRFGNWSELGTMGYSDKSVYASESAVWIANTYVVSFSANGGSGNMSEQTFTYDQPGALNGNKFTYQYRNFAGWSMTPDGEVQYTDTQAVINLAEENGASVTLYAIWELMDGAVAEYTVEYYLADIGGGTYTASGSSATLYGEIGSTVTLSESDAKNIVGFTFDADNRGNVLTATVSEDGSTVLKMYYTRNSYDLIIDFGGEQIKVANHVLDEYDSIIGVSLGTKEIADKRISVPFGANIADYLPTETLTESGYIFSGWSNRGGTMTENGATVTAQWTPVKVTVTFHPGTYYMLPDNYDFEANTVVMVYDYGTEVELPASVNYENAGKVVTGWIFGTQQGNYPTISHMPLILVEGYYYYDSPSFRAPMVDEDGYYMYDDEGNMLYSDEYSVTISPFWSSDHSADVVVYNGNGGNGSMENMYVESYGFRALAECEFTYAGYRFAGWNTEADGSGTHYADGDDFYGDSTSSSLVTILYAQWEKIS